MTMAGVGLKEMARERTVKIGHFIVEFVAPGIGYLLKNAGCDFVLFDTEHSGFHNETIKSALRYFEAAQLPVIVRVPSKEYHHIARAMDMGAEGLMVPMVNDAAEARAILDCMKYVPQGKRGVALGVAHDHYTGGAVLDKLAAANKRSTLFAQIETAAGVENADEIAALDGVDCLWVGHFDLTCSLGIPGDFNHPKFKDAIARTYAACKKHNKAYGRLVPDVSTGVDVFNLGFDFVCYSGDVWVYQAALKAGVDGVRNGARGKAGRAAVAPAKKPAKAK
jgi:2-dehydro-3-deoxyglucarate aldolase/4-hydroxy-2-oxoheptanedioate aldolase